MNYILIKNTFATIFKRPEYLAISFFVSLTLFFLFILVNNFPAVTSVVKITASPSLVLDVLLNSAANIFYVSGIIPFVAILFVSVLSGIAISIFIYQRNITKSIIGKGNVMSFGGIFSGSLSAGCSACSTTLISILGVAGGLATFPLKGLEFSILSIVVLSISIFFLLKGTAQVKGCQI
ncbi:MAG: hypothetical protein WEB28_03060 [Nitrosopumilaceae archaeon]